MRAEELDASEEFDVVTMMDVIEHVPKPLKVIAAARRALRPGGHVVVYTPNHRAAVVVVARLLHWARLDFAIREIFGRNHVCFFDNRTLPQALRKAGFSVENVVLLPYYPFRAGPFRLSAWRR